MKVLTALIGLTLAASSFANVLFAQSGTLGHIDTIENFPTGTVNWTQGRILATGIGVPNLNLPLAVSKEAAKRAATMVARRNLLEMTQGIRVDSETTVQNFLVKSDRIQTKVSGLIRGAVIEHIEEFSHGGIEVTLSMALSGSHSLELALLEKHDSTNPTFPQEESNQAFSGIIIDARNLRLKPAIFPKIIEEDGEVIYGQDTPNKQALKSQGFVRYETIQPPQKKRLMWIDSDQFRVFRIKDSAHPASRVGRRPLRIKGLRKHGTLKTDVIISKEDAEKIKQTPSLLQALKKANLVIITDPLVAGIQGHQQQGLVYYASIF